MPYETSPPEPPMPTPEQHTFSHASIELLGGVVIEGVVVTVDISEIRHKTSPKVVRAWLARSLDKLAQDERGIVISLRPADSDETHQDLSNYNPDYFEEVQLSEDSAPVAVVKGEHFARSNSPNGMRVFNLLSGGVHGLRYYAKYLEPFVVRDPATRKILGFNAATFGAMLDDGDKYVRYIPGFGQGSYTILLELYRNLLGQSEESDN